MIKNKIKNARGISLISLTVTIAVLMILTNIIIYNAKDNLKIGNLREMQNDIENLKDKVSSFYVQNGKIPAKMKYSNVEHIRSAGLISSALDTGEFYVIDLSVLENLTLNCGKDFENIKNFSELTQEQEKSNTDLYIINEESHNIFYVAGVTVDNEIYYTNYRAEEVDKIAPDLRYVDNIKIPNGYYYAGGTKEVGILIKNADNTETYRWVPVEEDITEIPSGVEILDTEKADFIKSVNNYQGYYKNTNTSQVIFLTLDKWSPIYDTKGLYKDKNGDTAYIPEGFQVSETPSESTIDGGLVIRDSDKNEFVWVPVPNIDDFHTIKSYSSNSLQDIEGVYFEPSKEGYRYSTEEAEYNAMKDSVEKNKGFYIGRYEAGNDGNNNVIVQKGVTVYNNIPWGTSMTNITGGAVEKAKSFTTGKSYEGKVTSTLIYGVQWDATMQFMDSKYLTEECVKDSYVRNSTGKGWYSDNYNVTTKGNTETNPNRETGKDLIYSNNPTIIANRQKNIYDMAGNVSEWIMEAHNTDVRVGRGGNCGNDGSTYSASSRNSYGPAHSHDNIGFRLALYL